MVTKRPAPSAVFFSGEIDSTTSSTLTWSPGTSSRWNSNSESVATTEVYPPSASSSVSSSEPVRSPDGRTEAA